MPRKPYPKQESGRRPPLRPRTKAEGRAPAYAPSPGETYMVSRGMMPQEYGRMPPKIVPMYSPNRIRRRMRNGTRMR